MLAIDPLLSLAPVGLYPLMLFPVRLFGGRMMLATRSTLWPCASKAGRVAPLCRLMCAPPAPSKRVSELLR